MKVDESLVKRYFVQYEEQVDHSDAVGAGPRNRLR